MTETIITPASTSAPAPVPVASRSRASKAAGWLMLLFPASVLTTSFGVHLTLLLVLISLGFLVRRGLVRFYAEHAREVKWIALAFGGYFVLTLLRMIWYRDSSGTLDGPSRMLFALGCIGFVGMLRPSIRMFWIGLGLGTIGGALIGGYQWFVLGIGRAMGATHHPISYGDLAVAMGVMSFCSMNAFRGTRLAWLPVTGLLCGALASLFSGSRGAWLGLLIVLWPMLKYGSHIHGKAIRYTVGVVLAACVLAYALPHTGVAGRMADAVSDVERYYSTNEASTNVGTRLELWKASAMMIAEHPFIGVGRDAFYDELQALHQQGRLQQSIALIYSTPHNDVLNTLATGGLLDLSFLLLIYAAPFAFFARTLRQGPPAAAAPALAGVLLVICFIAFGLTDVMFWLMLTKAFYATTVCVLVGFCLAAKAPPAALTSSIPSHESNASTT